MLQDEEEDSNIVVFFLLMICALYLVSMAIEVYKTLRP